MTEPELRTIENEQGCLSGCPVQELVDEVRRLQAMLAGCYRASGEDGDRNEDWRLAEWALLAVQRLRIEADELGEALDAWRGKRV